MVKREGKRVGARQWRVLLAANGVYPGSIGDGDIRDAVGRDFTPAQARSVTDSLVRQQLLLRTWVSGQDASADEARYTITEEGASARLDVAGRNAIKEEAVAVLV